MMNKLGCDVTVCLHNEDNRCRLNGILVEGPAARESSQTCCASFEERRRGQAENAVCGCSCSGESSIDCKAEYCVYNEDCKCTADRVQVGCSCGDVCSKSGTECCTFRPE